MAVVIYCGWCIKLKGFTGFAVNDEFLGVSFGFIQSLFTEKFFPTEGY
jgi:hypothetical protein